MRPNPEPEDTPKPARTRRVQARPLLGVVVASAKVVVLGAALPASARKRFERERGPEVKEAVSGVQPQGIFTHMSVLS